MHRIKKSTAIRSLRRRQRAGNAQADLRCLRCGWQFIEQGLRVGQVHRTAPCVEEPIDLPQASVRLRIDRTRHGRGSLSRAVRTIVIPARGRRQSPARLAGKLLSRLKSKTMLLADRGYDADWIRASMVSSCRTFREEPLARGLVSSGRDRLPTAPCEARAVRS